MGHKLNKSGLQAKKVHTKSGMRTYWVKAKEAAKSAGKRIASTAMVAGRKVAQHKGKIAGAAALATAAYIGVKHGSKIGGAFSGARKGLAAVHKLNDMASKLPDAGEKTPPSRSEKALGIMAGAIRGARAGAKRDAARVASITGAPRNALNAVKDRLWMRRVNKGRAAAKAA